MIAPIRLMSHPHIATYYAKARSSDLATFPNHDTNILHNNNVSLNSKLQAQSQESNNRNIRMLLAIPGWILSPLCLNMYITDAQLKAERMANGNWAGGMGFGFAWGEVSGGRG